MGEGVKRLETLGLGWNLTIYNISSFWELIIDFLDNKENGR